MTSLRTLSAALVIFCILIFCSCTHNAGRHNNGNIAGTKQGRMIYDENVELASIVSRTGQISEFHDVEQLAEAVNAAGYDSARNAIAVKMIENDYTIYLYGMQDTVRVLFWENSPRFKVDLTWYIFSDRDYSRVVSLCRAYGLL